MIKLQLTSPKGSDEPFEREYEGWISWLIEDYLNALGYEVDVYCFSPYDEKYFPADEIFIGKDFGFAFQFKRPRFDNPGRKITWKIEKHQRELIEQIKGIYYALPTFANRRAKELSLSNFIIWHPQWEHSWMGEEIITKSDTATLVQRCPYGKDVPPLNDRDVGERSYSLRWGAFIEYLQNKCLLIEVTDFQKSLNDAIKIGNNSRNAKPKKRKSQSTDIVEFATAENSTFEIANAELDNNENSQMLIVFLLRDRTIERANNLAIADVN